MTHINKQDFISAINKVIELRPQGITDTEIATLTSLRKELELATSIEQYVQLIIEIIRFIGIASNYLEN